MEPTISVIIPTYNRSLYIERAILSVFQQTRSCDELIIVDDGSQDDTDKVVDRLKNDHNVSLTYIYQDNSGPASARNRGVRESSSELIAFLDSDDHWYRRKLEKQINMMNDNPNYLVSHTKERWMRRGKHLNQKKIHIPRSGYLFDHCLQLCAVGMSTVMARRELFDTIGWFNEDFHCCEDYEFWLRVSARYEFLLVDEPLTVKEGGRQDQLSNRYRIGMDKLRIDAILNILQDPQLSEKNRLLAVDQLKRKSRIYGNGCLKHGNHEEGLRYLELADTCDDSNCF